MSTRASVTLDRLLDLLKRSSFDLKLTRDAAAGLGLSPYLLGCIERAKQETGSALRAAEAVKAQEKKKAA